MGVRVRGLHEYNSITHLLTSCVCVRKEGNVMYAVDISIWVWTPRSFNWGISKGLPHHPVCRSLPSLDSRGVVCPSCARKQRGLYAFGCEFRLGPLKAQECRHRPSW